MLKNKAPKTDSPEYETLSFRIFLARVIEITESKHPAPLYKNDCIPENKTDDTKLLKSPNKRVSRGENIENTTKVTQFAMPILPPGIMLNTGIMLSKKLSTIPTEQKMDKRASFLVRNAVNLLFSLCTHNKLMGEAC